MHARGRDRLAGAEVPGLRCAAASSDARSRAVGCRSTCRPSAQRCAGHRCKVPPVVCVCMCHVAVYPHMAIHPSIHPSVHSIHLPSHLPADLSTHPPIHLPLPTQRGMTSVRRIDLHVRPRRRGGDEVVALLRAVHREPPGEVPPAGKPRAREAEEPAEPLQLGHRVIALQLCGSPQVPSPHVRGALFRRSGGASAGGGSARECGAGLHRRTRVCLRARASMSRYLYI
jgi:hypothetical protein